MLGVTHIATASTIATLPLLINPNIDIKVYIYLYIGILIGSILPDIDEPDSIIGKKLAFIAYPINIIFGHRTITHNIFVSIFVSILGLISNIDIIVGIGVGMFIHILSDSLTVGGIYGALFPIGSMTHRFTILPYIFRFKVGGIAELVLLFILCIYNIYIYTTYIL